MQAESLEHTFIHKAVTYVVELNGHFMIVENVPARECVETGERFFAPETVEKLQKIAWERHTPKRIEQTPVFEFQAA